MFVFAGTAVYATDTPHFHFRVFRAASSCPSARFTRPIFSRARNRKSWRSSIAHVAREFASEMVHRRTKLTKRSIAIANRRTTIVSPLPRIVLSATRLFASTTDGRSIDRSITLYLPFLLRRERARDERLDLSRTSTRRDCDVRAFFAMTESKRRPWLLLVPVHERCKSGHNCVPSLSHLFTALSVFVSVYVPDFWSRSFFESLHSPFRDRSVS